MRITFWRIFLIFSVYVITTSQCWAVTPKAYDINSFEVAGVKLGMSKTDVINSISTKYKVDKSKLNFNNFGDFEILNVEISSTSRVVIHLNLKIPADKPGQLIVTEVAYDMPYTQDNKKLMNAAAFEKYGEPTGKESGIFTKWCSKPDPRGDGCLYLKGDPQGPELGLSGTKLTLSDPTYIKTRQDHLDKLRSSKPAF